MDSPSAASIEAGFWNTGWLFVGSINFYPMPLTNTELKNLNNRSSLYREFQAEREEILRHKWIESEKAGNDIGFEKALISWVMNHRPAWRRMRRDQGTKSQTA